MRLFRYAEVEVVEILLHAGADCCMRTTLPTNMLPHELPARVNRSGRYRARKERLLRQGYKGISAERIVFSRACFLLLAPLL